MDINPALKLTRTGILSDRAFEIVTDEFDYVLDCIDSVTRNWIWLLAPREKS
jgi:tRNA A37 threonylcarbamoyladenosine dehydratase